MQLHWYLQLLFAVMLQPQTPAQIWFSRPVPHPWRVIPCPTRLPRIWPINSATRLYSSTQDLLPDPKQHILIYITMCSGNIILILFIICLLSNTFEPNPWIKLRQNIIFFAGHLSGICLCPTLEDFTYLLQLFYLIFFEGKVFARDRI